MIRLVRGPKPSVLDANEVDWADEYLRGLQGDASVPKAALTRYAHGEIKDAVERDAHGKCIYCESKPLAVYPGAIEHIRPKSRDAFPELVVTWENLGFVCFECNRLKSDYWDAAAPIIDPYSDEPSEHLVFLGPMVLARHPSLRGRITVHKLGLDRRLDLIERKVEHIRIVDAYLNQWTTETNEALRTVLSEKLRELAQPDQEYTATTRALLEAAGFPYDP